MSDFVAVHKTIIVIAFVNFYHFVFFLRWCRELEKRIGDSGCECRKAR